MKRVSTAGSARCKRILYMIREESGKDVNLEEIENSNKSKDDSVQITSSSSSNHEGTFQCLARSPVSVEGITEFAEVDSYTSRIEDLSLSPTAALLQEKIPNQVPRNYPFKNITNISIHQPKLLPVDQPVYSSDNENISLEEVPSLMTAAQDTDIVSTFMYNDGTQNVLQPTVLLDTEYERPILPENDLLDISNNTTNIDPIYVQETDPMSKHDQADSCSLASGCNSSFASPLSRQNINFIASPTVVFLNKDGDLPNISDLENVLHEIENPSIQLPEIVTSEQDCNVSSPNGSRKRKRNEGNWQDKQNKTLKNTGKAYTSVRSKKSRPEKTIGPVCNCKFKCFEKLDDCVRNSIFTKYWAIGDHERQWDFLLRYVTKEGIKKMTFDRKNNRLQTIIYHLPTDVEMDTSIRVCKTMFLNTLRITQQVVYTALDKKEGGGCTDLRGQHDNRPKKMSLETEQSVITHINKFERVEAHYVRKDSQKEYLEETLNISKMHRLYLSWIDTELLMNEVIRATRRQYEYIFNTKFNISFHKPKKDLCEVCSIYKNADNVRKEQLKEEYEKHLRAKTIVREIKEKEKREFDKVNSVVACFDLEKVLTIPKSEVGSFHYKRKYPIYNFTVFDILELKGFCYVWHYQIAKRGAIEIASCLWSFIQDQASQGKTKFSFYSDSCSGQNRNRFVFAMFALACKAFEIEISHRFLEKGHSQSEGDSMHAAIERAKKRHTIYTPDQMYYLIENAKVTGHKYEIKQMTQAHFFDFKDVIKGKNWLSDINGVKIYWSKIKEVIFSHNHPDHIYFRYSLETELQELQTTSMSRTNSRRRGREITEYTAEQLKPAYDALLPIPAPLYKDLISLCDSGAIPRHYHAFYRNLVPSDTTTRMNDDSDME